MNVLIVVFSLLTLLVPSEFRAPAGTDNAGGGMDSSVVEGANNYLKAVLAGDVPGIVAMYREDASLMPPNQPLLQGRQAIGAFYERMCHGPVKITAFTFDHLESTIAGDTAYDVGTYRMTMAVAPGQMMKDSGKYSVILKKTGTDWKIAYLIFNSDAPQSMPKGEGR
jgi:uncharacterized protein (TIGR02246 family)